MTIKQRTFTSRNYKLILLVCRILTGICGYIAINNANDAANGVAFSAKSIMWATIIGMAIREIQGYILEENTEKNDSN